MGVYLQIGDLKSYFLERRILQLADGDVSKTMAAQNAETKARLEAVIESAESEANAYLQRRYKIPVLPAPGRLKLCVGLLSIYYLFEIKPELYNGDNPYQSQYDKELAWLQDLQGLDVEIGDSAVTDESGGAIFVEGNSNGLIFGGGGLDQF